MQSSSFWFLGLSLVLNCVPALAKSFERHPLSRPATEPITLPRNWVGHGTGASDRQPEISLVDEAKGEYRLIWVGHDGDRKEITYHEPDRISVIARAVVSEGITGKYRYEYEVRSQPASSQDTYGVVIQAFGDVPKFVIPGDGRYLGEMTRAAPEFSAGTWYRIPLEAGELSPGMTVRIVIESDSAPGLVHMRAHGGPLGMKGVGEEPPEILTARLPRYEAWPVGLTIGPVESIDDPAYQFGPGRVSEMIAAMVDAGWVDGTTGADYLQMIESGAFREALSAVSADVKRGSVAPEVAPAIRRLIGSGDNQ